MECRSLLCAPVRLVGLRRSRSQALREEAWLVVIDGAIEVSTAAGERVSGGVGLLIEFAPGERHEVTASSAARLLLLLTPWPGSGQPGAMTIQEKLYTRRHAAKRAQ